MSDVSVVDLTVKLVKPASYAKICSVIKATADDPMAGIMGYCDEDIVSTDLLRKFQDRGQEGIHG